MKGDILINYISHKIKKAINKILIRYGYFKMKLTFLTDEEISNMKKALYNITPYTSIRSSDFPNFLTNDKRKKLAEICKEIFAKNQSPKDYAIMFCLLTDEKFISIPERKKTRIYISWYNYIGDKIPKRKNFTAINKFILDKAGNGFVFKDEYDPDFIHLKEILIQKLKDI